MPEVLFISSTEAETRLPDRLGRITRKVDLGGQIMKLQITDKMRLSDGELTWEKKKLKLRFA